MTCQKRGYPDRWTVDLTIERIHKTSESHKRCRSYFCPECKMFHISSKHLSNVDKVRHADSVHTVSSPEAGKASS